MSERMKSVTKTRYNDFCDKLILSPHFTLEMHGSMIIGSIIIEPYISSVIGESIKLSQKSLDHSFVTDFMHSGVLYLQGTR